jgi:hypothetical protein
MKEDWMRKFWFACVLTMVWAAAIPALAHHSTAMFDLTQQTTLVGHIKAFQWTNPHAWIQVTVPGPDGDVEWSIECGSPNSLSRQGWKATMFATGDRVQIVASPMKDGTHAAMLVSVTLADGRVFGPGAPAAR